MSSFDCTDLGRTVHLGSDQLHDLQEFAATEGSRTVHKAELSPSLDDRPITGTVWQRNWSQGLALACTSPSGSAPKAVREKGL